MSDRKLGDLLDDAKRTITQDRIDTHGQPEDSFSVIAGYYSVYLTQRLGVLVALTPLDAVNMAVLFKQARKLGQRQHVDNYVDGAGYEAIGGWMVEQAEAAETVPLEMTVEDVLGLSKPPVGDFYAGAVPVPQRVDVEVGMDDVASIVLGPGLRGAAIGQDNAGPLRMTAENVLSRRGA